MRNLEDKMMEDEIIDFERIHNYEYNRMNYYLEIFHLEKSYVKAFAYSQINIDQDIDETPGMGEDFFDKYSAIRKAIKHLHTQYN